MRTYIHIIFKDKVKKWEIHSDKRDGKKWKLQNKNKMVINEREI